MDTQANLFSEVADCRLTNQRGGKSETISLVHGTTTYLQTLDIPALITKGGANVYLCATIAERLYNEIPNNPQCASRLQETSSKKRNRNDSWRSLPD